MSNYYCTCKGSDSCHVTMKNVKVDSDDKCLECGYYAHYGRPHGVFLEKHEKNLDKSGIYEVIYETERTFIWT